MSGYHTLPKAVVQAKELEATLRAKGFEILPSLYDSAATKENIENALRTAPATEDDRLLVYFGGHGDDIPTFQGKAYGFLVPFNGKKNDLAGTAIPVQDLRDKYAQILKAKQIFFALDSCQSGLAINSGAGTGASEGARD